MTVSSCYCCTYIAEVVYQRKKNKKEEEEAKQKQEDENKNGAALVCTQLEPCIDLADLAVVSRWMVCHEWLKRFLGEEHHAES